MSAAVDTALADILEREPRLDGILCRLRGSAAKPGRHDAVHLEHLRRDAKQKVYSLVGFGRADGDPILSTTTAHTLVMDAIVDILGA